MHKPQLTISHAVPCHLYTHPPTHALIHPEAFPSPYQLHYHRPLAPAAALTERLEALNKLSNWAQPNGLPPISAGEVSELLQRWGLGWEVPPHVQGEASRSLSPHSLPRCPRWFQSLQHSCHCFLHQAALLWGLTGKCNFRSVRCIQRRLTASACLWLPCVAGMYAAQYERQLQLHSSLRCGRGTSPSSARVADSSSRKRPAPPGGAWDPAAGEEEGDAVQAVAAAKRGRWKAALQLALGHPQVGHTGGERARTGGSSAAWPGVPVHALGNCCFASKRHNRNTVVFQRIQQTKGSCTECARPS
jgi:hypothetical protein